MITLAFREHVSGEKYVKLKMGAKRLIEAGNIEFIQTTKGDVLIVAYEGSDIYSIHTLHESKTTPRLGGIDNLLSEERDVGSYFGPRVAASTEVLKTDALRDALQEAGILSSDRTGLIIKEKEVPTSSELRKRITPRWLRALKGEDKPGGNIE